MTITALLLHVTSIIAALLLTWQMNCEQGEQGNVASFEKKNKKLKKIDKEIFKSWDYYKDDVFYRSAVTQYIWLWRNLTLRIDKRNIGRNFLTLIWAWKMIWIKISRKW